MGCLQESRISSLSTTTGTHNDTMTKRNRKKRKHTHTHAQIQRDYGKEWSTRKQRSSEINIAIYIVFNIPLYYLASGGSLNLSIKLSIKSTSYLEAKYTLYDI